MRSRIAIAGLAVAGFMAAQGQASAFTGTVDRITDADTFFVGGTEVRLDGVDAPDADQVCTRGGEKYKCGEEAKAGLLAIVQGRPVTCQKVGEDLYKRAVVRCVVGGRDLGAQLVSAGWAVAFRKFSKRYVAQEEAAKKAKRGLWEGTFDRPRVWRRKKQNWVN